MRKVFRAGTGAHGLKTRRLMRREKLQKAREMRLAPTPAEAALWAKLRMGATGFKFRRQALVRGYIVDFWCPRAKLVVEVDGGYHHTEEQYEYDRSRTEHLRALGISVMRLRNELVLESPVAAAQLCKQAAAECLLARSDSPSIPLRRASREAAGQKAGATTP